MVALIKFWRQIITQKDSVSLWDLYHDLVSKLSHFDSLILVVNIDRHVTLKYFLELRKVLSVHIECSRNSYIILCVSVPEATLEKKVDSFIRKRDMACLKSRHECIMRSKAHTAHYRTFTAASRLPFYRQ